LFTYLWLACRFLRSAVRSRCDVALENLALRQQLVVVGRQYSIRIWKAPQPSASEICALKNAVTRCLGDMCSTGHRDPVPRSRMLYRALGPGSPTQPAVRLRGSQRSDRKEPSTPERGSSYVRPRILLAVGLLNIREDGADVDDNG